MVTQVAWLTKDDISALDWLDIEWRLIRKLGGNPAVCDPTRPLLLPGSERLVPARDEYLAWDEIECDKLSPDLRYTLEQMREALPYVPGQLIPGFEG